MFKKLILPFFCLWIVQAQAQIKWRVEVITSQLNTAQVTEKAIFNNLKSDINTFLNGQRWSEDEFEEMWC